MAQPVLQTNYNITVEIGTAYSEGTWTYAPLAEGIENWEFATNEEIQQYFFKVDNGFARNHVTGMAPALTVSGRRVFGDAAQDYIMGNIYGLDKDRQSSVKITWTAGSTSKGFTCDCTLVDLNDISGDMIEDRPFNVEIRLDGEPQAVGA